MSALSELRVKWQLPKPNEVRKVVIPYGMLKGTYEISVGELTDTSGNVLTPYFIRENYDPSRKFALRDFGALFDSYSGVRGTGIELAQWQHLMPIWLDPNIDQGIHDSLKGKLLYTDSATVRQGERYFMGRRHVAENGELSLDLSRPYAETAFSDGGVSELSEHTLWKPLPEQKTFKTTELINLFNIRDNEIPNRFVDADFWSGGYVFADASRHPLGRSFGRGALSVKKIE